jgi:hypothetical protein
MNRRQRYHFCAADCFATAQEAYNPYRRKLYLSMASSWLSLAQHAEVADRFFAMPDPPIGTDETLALMRPATHGATTSRFGQSISAHPELTPVVDISLPPRRPGLQPRVRSDGLTP